jgi:hypothetical protein
MCMGMHGNDQFGPVMSRFSNMNFQKSGRGRPMAKNDMGRPMEGAPKPLVSHVFYVFGAGKQWERVERVQDNPFMCIQHN